MSLARIRKPTLIVLSLLLTLVVLSFALQPAAPESGSNVIALKAPFFARAASAQEAPAAPYAPGAEPPALPQPDEASQTAESLNVSVDGENTFVTRVAGSSLDQATFRPDDGCTLPAPSLIFPVGGVQVDTLVPHLEWSRTGDVYDVQVSAISDFSILTYEYHYHIGGTSNPRVVLRFNLSPSTTYYWRVASRCPYPGGESAFSSASFRTSNVTGLPGTPSMIAPTDGAVQSSLEVTFRWTNVSGATGWQLRRYDSLSMAQNDDQWHQFPDTMAVCDINCSDNSFMWTMESPATYYWRILAATEAGLGPLSPVRSFTVGASTYTISGRVTDASGTAVPGVTVWAGFPRNTTTDGDGNYRFTGLPAGTYNITPDQDPYAFSPASLPVTVPPDAKDRNFTAVAITNIQVNQALGNTTNYVADKDTAVRVFMSAKVPFDPDNQELTIYRDGSQITPIPLKPQRFSDRSEVLNFLCDRETCDGWQKGFYSFEARINGDYLIQPSVEFKERKSLRILVVPVLTKAGEVNPLSDRWKTAQQFLQKVYPIAQDGVAWDHGRQVDAKDLDLTTEAGKGELQKRLYARRPLKCKIALGFGVVCYDVILGVLPEGSLCSPQQTPCPLPGQGYPEIRMAFVTDRSDLQHLIAHEVGHIVGYTGDAPSGLGDEYDRACGAFQCGINPPPSSYVGRNGPGGDCAKPISCQFSQAKPWEGNAGMGSKVFGVGVDQDYPFDVTATHALTDSLSFMGAAGAGLHNYWVTPRAYNYLFGSLPNSTQTVTAAQAEERVLFVSGSIRRDGTASLEPAHHTLYAAPPIVAGEYTLNIVGASGDTLASQGFNASFVVLSDPPQELDEAPFGVAVRLPDGARTLRIMRGTTTLAQRAISAHAPTLSLTSPSGGETWAAPGTYTIRWQGNDVDGDSLYYTVLYRQGADEWSVLGADLTANELTVDAADLPGGTAARIQVLATDGINTTVVESAPFTVGRKPPETFITYPVDGAGFMPGVSLFLQGTAYDLEDGMLPDSAYRWSSDKDGDLGTGASNLVILSSGAHVITLTVTDSDGNTAVKTVRLSAGYQRFLPAVLRAQ